MYEAYADDIFRYHFVHVRDTQLAEDLTADTFAKAWKNLDSFDFSQPRPWLYKIAQNLLTDYWRKQKALPLDEPELLPADTDTAASLDRQLTGEWVKAALDKLSEPMRSVITMRFMLGYSARRTGQALGLSESNVRIIQYRALKKMKEYLS